MRLADFLREDYVIPDLQARDKGSILGELAGFLTSKVDGVSREEALKALNEREKLGSTGIGHGVALPHGKIRGVREIKIFFARSVRGVDFNSMDRLPVHIFFLIIAPENSSAAHLKLLASISRILKSQDFRARLMRAATSSEIFRLISEADRNSTRYY